MQSLLEPREAALVYLLSGKGSFLWVVRRDRSRQFRLTSEAEEIVDGVRLLRQRLDLTNIKHLSDLRSFPLALSHELYKTIIGPAETLLEGVDHLIVVPDAELASLPFGVLVSESIREDIKDLSDYADVPWLAKRFAFTTLPSVSSLHALRVFAKRSPAPEAFAGFGDPILYGEDRERRGLSASELFDDNQLANVEAVRSLPRLPETAQELYAIAKALKAGRNNVYLREAASERRVKSMPLSAYRVIMFSTHGLMSGDFRGVEEPALVLTPPESVSQQDDGLLTASEVAQLDLNADIVVLSACNTAAPDGAGGTEGFSGLARSFFYSGSRALLVSHWSVSSEATVRLMSGMFHRLGRQPELGRAEALRQSMLALMDDPSNPQFAHPAFWAPFVVVGEGASPVRAAGS